MDTKQAYLDKWKAKWDALNAQAREKFADAKIKAAREWNEYTARSSDWQKRYEDLKAAGEDTWEGLKDGVEQSWRNVQESFDRLRARFNT